VRQSVNRGGFSGTCRTGGQEHSRHIVEPILEFREFARGKTEFSQRSFQSSWIEEPHDERLAVMAGGERKPDIQIASVQFDRRPRILGAEMRHGIEVGNGFELVQDHAALPGGKFRHVTQHAVNSEAQPCPCGAWQKMSGMIVADASPLHYLIIVAALERDRRRHSV